MPKRKRPEEKPEDQFKRFIESATTLGVEENSKEVEKSFGKLASGSQSKIKRRTEK